MRGIWHDYDNGLFMDDPEFPGVFFAWAGVYLPSDVQLIPALTNEPEHGQSVRRTDPDQPRRLRALADRPSIRVCAHAQPGRRRPDRRPHALQPEPPGREEALIKTI